ncbi:MAG: N-acetylmuramoyl-L-alanine amidase [Verrucomicrobia bacterium]|nr:N-acetylmuramoyl-L-alanine amidase [Verrucomicrobiota bacterium]
MAIPLLVFLLAITNSPAAWQVIMVEGRRHVPVEDVSRFYQLPKPTKNGRFFEILGKGRKMRGEIGKREIFINNVKYVLCFPIRERNGSILISAMDVTKIIEPVMRPSLIKNAAPIRTVILDAGHGGHDSGAKGSRGIEKEAALDVVLRAKRLLEQNGYTVHTTRSRDVFIQFPNAIFVSVHFNKSLGGGASGIETFALAPRGVPSMDEENFSYSDLKQHPGHARDPENIALATALHSSMLRQMRLYDRGIKRARFVVIRDIKIPGVLLEGGFMNHPVDGRLIASSQFRDAFARAILEGVSRYRSALSGRRDYQEPSAVASATDKSSVPDLTPAVSATGVPSSLNEAVQRAAEEIKKKAAEKPSPTPNAN